MAKSASSVSVIVTVLNEANSIKLLLAALTSQTHLPTEVIIVDGGSTDATVSLIEKAAKVSSVPIKVFVQSGNRSLGRNLAISKAKSNLIAITDAGCLPHTNWLEELLKQYHIVKQARSKTQLVVAGYYDAQPRTAFEEAIVPYVLVMPDRVNPESFLPATRSMLIEKQTWVELNGFDENLSDNEDYAFAKKLAARKIPITFTAVAKVTWQPRTNLRSFMWMIYRFARGDIQSGIIRPKVVFIFLRTGIWWGLTLCLALNAPMVANWFVVSSLVAYAGWSIQKNLRYTPRGWFWLPVMQISSDAMVIFGSLAGLLRRLRVN